MRREESYRNIVTGAWRKTSCEKMIAFLEGLNFRFVEFDHIAERFDIRGMPPTHYRFMVRMHQIDPQDPTKDLYDYNLIWAIDLVGKTRQVFIWLNLRAFKKGKKSWDSGKQINFKPKKKGTRYPDWMSIDDRIEYRRIEKKLCNRGVSKEEEEFFNRCYPAVKELNH